MTDPRLIIQECEQFAAAHVVELARDLVILRDTGTINQCRLRELGRIFQKLGVSTSGGELTQAMAIARNAILDAFLQSIDSRNS